MTDTLKESDGLLWIDRGPTSDDHLAFTGHESALVPFVKMLAKPDKSYINIGAHVGTWALRVAKFGLASHVYAIEANPITYDILIRNINLNKLANSISPIRVALWDKPFQVIHLVDVNGKSSGGSTRTDLVGDDVGFYTETLDSYYLYTALSEFGKAGLIQMDVEGAEARILRGSSKLLEGDRPNLLIELHEGHPGTDKDLREQVYTELEKHNYNYFSVNVCGDEEHLICRPAEELDEFVPEIIKGSI